MCCVNSVGDVIDIYLDINESPASPAAQRVAVL